MSWPTRAISFSFYSLALLLPLLFLPQTSELFEFNKMLAVYFFSVIIAGSWAVQMVNQRRWLLRRTPLDLPLLAFLGSQVISFFFSIDKHLSVFGYYSRLNGGLLSLFCYSLLYWAFVSFMDAPKTRLFLKTLIISTSISAFWAVLEHFGFSFSCLFITGEAGVSCWVQDVQNRVFSTLGQPNWLAALLVALIFVPLSKIFSNFKFQISNFLLFVLLFSALLFTKSRSGLLAFVVCAAIFVFFAFKHKSFQISKIKFQILGIVTAALTLTVIFPNPVRDLVAPQLVKTVTQTAVPAPSGTSLESGGTESGLIRQIVWSGALRIWQADWKNLLVGTGPETFANSYFQFRPVEHNNTSEWELLYNKAHNEFLNYLANTGLLGLATYLLLLLTITRFFLKTLNDHRMTTNDHGMTIALLSGWASISITNFWGFSTVIINLLLFLFPAVSLSLAAQPVKPAVTKKANAYQKLVILLICFTTTLLVYRVANYWYADTLYAAAQKAYRSFTYNEDANQLVSAVDLYSRAVSANPEPTFLSDFSVAAAYLSILTSDTDASDRLRRLARASSDTALSTSPATPNYYKSRFRMYILLSAFDPSLLAEADRSIAAAQRLSPTDPRLPYNRAVVAKYQSALPQAVEFNRQALSLKPDFAEALQLETELASASAKIAP